MEKEIEDKGKKQKEYINKKAKKRRREEKDSQLRNFLSQYTLHPFHSLLEIDPMTLPSQPQVYSLVLPTPIDAVCRYQLRKQKFSTMAFLFRLFLLSCIPNEQKKHLQIKLLGMVV